MSTAASSGTLRFPSCRARSARPIYDAMNEALAKLHAIDVAAAGLSDFGKPGSYFARQLQRWSEQYRASETERIDDMDRLIVWLGAHVPADDGRVALVHGDWRIDNMIFDADSRRASWRCSTGSSRRSAIPSPTSPISACNGGCPTPGAFRGLGGVDRAALGIPTEADYVADYCRRVGLDAIPRLDLPHRLQLLSRRRDRPGRLQALARRQRLEPRARPANGRSRAADGAPGDEGGRDAAS